MLEARHFFLEIFFGLKNVTKSVLVLAFEIGLDDLDLLLEDVQDVIALYSGLSPPALYILHEGWMIYPKAFKSESPVLRLVHIGEVHIHWPVI